jgi:hypothetical protein
MFDLKAGDYATAVSSDPTALVPTQTLIVATGVLPFVVADPQLGGLSAVLYPPRDASGAALSQQPLIDGITGQFRLQFGMAAALGNISVRNVIGAAVKTIRVVIDHTRIYDRFAFLLRPFLVQAGAVSFSLGKSSPSCS